MTATPAPSVAATARDHLRLLRRDLSARLNRAPLDGCVLALAAGLAAALALVEVAPPPADPGSRVALADDGERLVLTIYGPAGPQAATELSVSQALKQPADLVTATQRRSG